MLFLYEIKDGDTVESICKNAGVSAAALAYVNASTVSSLKSKLPYIGFVHIPVVLTKNDLRKLRDAFKEKSA